MEKITINNFRKARESWELNLAPITFLTGTNNSGKSSVLKALMLLDSFGNSKNHFILNFNGKHSRNHKIDCFSNAINRYNSKENKYEINFSIENKNYVIDYEFYPLEDNEGKFDEGKFDKGKLKKISFKKKEDNSIFSINSIGGDEYQLTIDNSFIHDEYEDIYSLNNELNMYKSLKLKIERDLFENEYFLKRIDNDSFQNQSIYRKIDKDLIDKKFPDKDFLENKNMLRDSDGIYSNKLYYMDTINSLKDKLNNINRRIKTIDNKDSKDNLQFNPTFKLSDFDGIETIDRVLRGVLAKYFRENEKSIGLINTNSEMFKISTLVDNIIDSLSLNISHLTPNRNTQTRLYVNESGNSDIYDIIRSHTENPIDKESKVAKFLITWMKEFGIGEDFRIKPIEGLASIIEVKEQEDWINLVDKGFGAGQIFTILFRIATVVNNGATSSKKIGIKKFRKSGHIVLIEEPEANLHPAFQSKLADLFLAAYREFGIQFIIETHSEYIIRKSQLLFVEYAKLIDHANPQGKDFPEMLKFYSLFAVYYFGKDGPYEMKYKKDGSFNKPFEEGFLDVVDDIALEIFLKNNSQ